MSAKLKLLKRFVKIESRQKLIGWAAMSALVIVTLAIAAFTINDMIGVFFGS